MIITKQKARARLHYDVKLMSLEDGWYFFLVSIERRDP